jgi:hypothetical protein
MLAIIALMSRPPADAGRAFDGPGAAAGARSLRSSSKFMKASPFCWWNKTPIRLYSLPNDHVLERGIVASGGGGCTMSVRTTIGIKASLGNGRLTQTAILN